MDHKKIAHDMERVIHKYVKSEELKRRYGTADLLTRKEIHTIQLIGEQPGVNLRTLAGRHGVTKGAASQMVSRLCEKGYLERCVSQTSLAEIALFLTEKGQQAFTAHEDYHARQGQVWEKALEGMTEHDAVVVERFLSAIENILDEEGEE